MTEWQNGPCWNGLLHNSSRLRSDKLRACAVWRNVCESENMQNLHIIQCRRSFKNNYPWAFSGACNSSNKPRVLSVSLSVGGQRSYSRSEKILIMCKYTAEMCNPVMAILKAMNLASKALWETHTLYGTCAQQMLCVPLRNKDSKNISKDSSCWRNICVNMIDGKTDGQIDQYTDGQDR